MTAAPAGYGSDRSCTGDCEHRNFCGDTMEYPSNETAMDRGKYGGSFVDCGRLIRSIKS